MRWSLIYIPKWFCWLSWMPIGIPNFAEVQRTSVQLLICTWNCNMCQEYEKPKSEQVLRELCLWKHSLWLFMVYSADSLKQQNILLQGFGPPKLQHMATGCSVSPRPCSVLSSSTFAYPRIIMLVIINWRRIFMFILIYNNIWTTWFSVYNPDKSLLSCCALYPTPTNSFSFLNVVKNATELLGSSNRSDI